MKHTGGRWIFYFPSQTVWSWSVSSSKTRFSLSRHVNPLSYTEARSLAPCCKPAVWAWHISPTQSSLLNLLWISWDFCLSACGSVILPSRTLEFILSACTSLCLLLLLFPPHGLYPLFFSLVEGIFFFSVFILSNFFTFSIWNLERWNV